MGIPGASLGKSEKRMRTQSYTSHLPEFPLASAPSTPTVPPPPERRRTSGKLTFGPSVARKSRRKGQLSQLSTKDLGRWKPTDDLALVLGVQQVILINIIIVKLSMCVQVSLFITKKINFYFNFSVFGNWLLHDSNYYCQ